MLNDEMMQTEKRLEDFHQLYSRSEAPTPGNGRELSHEAHMLGEISTASSGVNRPNRTKHSATPPSRINYSIHHLAHAESTSQSRLQIYAESWKQTFESAKIKFSELNRDYPSQLRGSRNMPFAKQAKMLVVLIWRDILRVLHP